MIKSEAYTLREAIVLQAVEDYRTALSGEKVDHKTPEETITEIENFFRSNSFRLLCDIDCEFIISEIRKEFNR